MALDENQRVPDQRPRYDCLLFDLDDTLYPLSSGLAAACTNNIAGLQPDGDQTQVYVDLDSVYVQYTQYTIEIECTATRAHAESWITLHSTDLLVDAVKSFTLATRELVRFGLCLRLGCCMTDYVNQKLGVEMNRVPDLCRELYTTYGTSMAGLRAVGYEFDYDDYHSFVHGRLPYENLKPDPVLKNLLLSMPQRKIIFTNGDKVHAANVLNRLGLEDCFEGIICFETLNPPSQITENSTDWNMPAVNCTIPKGPVVNSTIPKGPVICKPSKDAIEQALRLANTDPLRTIFFDDSPRNIAAGKRAALCTVLVGTSVRTKGADFALESIHNIREALPEIWEEEHEESSKNVPHSRGAVAAIETVVTA